MTSMRDELARAIATELLEPLPPGVTTIDPITISIIIQILTSLAPLIKNCIDESQDPEDVAVSICNRIENRKLGWRMYRWRLKREVEEHTGRDGAADEITDVIVRLGRDRKMADMLFDE